MEQQNSHARELPRYTIEGTEFIVDVRLNELREVDAPWNRISIDQIDEDLDGRIGFLYDVRTKNIATESVHPDRIPDHIKPVIFSGIIELDPVGWARKYGLADDAFTKKAGTVAGINDKEKAKLKHRRKRGKGL